MTNAELIEYPLCRILEDTRNVLSSVDWKMSAYTLYEYIMPTTFLKMAGTQEQKMKCICWELANHDYDYRYQRFIAKGWSLGTCADYGNKNTIFEDLCQQIIQYMPNFKGMDSSTKQNVINKSISAIESFYQYSNLSGITQRDYEYYQMLFTHLKDKNIAESTTSLLTKRGIDCLFNGKIFVKEESLLTMYNIMHRHRNNLAHNLTIYQDSYSFSEMLQANVIYNNYYIFFALLIIIDEIFIELYKMYKQLVQEYNE